METLSDNNIKDRGDWFNRHRMITIGLFLLIVWASIFYLLWSKADAVTKDPCSICASSLGEQVTCTSASYDYIKPRTFYPNGSWEDLEGLR